MAGRERIQGHISIVVAKWLWPSAGSKIERTMHSYDTYLFNDDEFKLIWIALQPLRQYFVFGNPSCHDDGMPLYCAIHVIAMLTKSHYARDHVL